MLHRALRTRGWAVRVPSPALSRGDAVRSPVGATGGDGVVTGSRGAAVGVRSGGAGFRGASVGGSSPVFLVGLTIGSGSGSGSAGRGVGAGAGVGVIGIAGLTGSGVRLTGAPVRVAKTGDGLAGAGIESSAFSAFRNSSAVLKRGVPRVVAP